MFIYDDNNDKNATDKQTTDRQMTKYSERECEFTFAKNAGNNNNNNTQLTWSTFQLRYLLMSAECLVAVRVLSARLIPLPTENHCQAFHPAATIKKFTLSY